MSESISELCDRALKIIEEAKSILKQKENASVNTKLGTPVRVNDQSPGEDIDR